MIKSIVQLVARLTSQRRSMLFKIISLISGSFLFMVVVPLILGFICHYAAVLLPVKNPDFIRYLAGTPAVMLGLGILIWAIASFWKFGEGTPAPVAAPQHLVVKGPYKYCRNPIQLGAIILYFGLGALCDSLITGTAMFLLGFMFGTLYHKLIEEKELKLRFGKEYEEYCQRTPFLLPRFVKRVI